MTEHVVWQVFKVISRVTYSQSIAVAICPRQCLVLTVPIQGP